MYYSFNGHQLERKDDEESDSLLPPIETGSGQLRNKPSAALLGAVKLR